MSRAAAQGKARRLSEHTKKTAIPAKIEQPSMSKKRNQSDLPKEDAVKREDGRDFDGEYEGDTDEFDSDDAGGEEGWVSDDGSEEEEDGNGMGAAAAEGLELDEVDEEGHKRTFVPGRDALEEGEELVVDSSAYDMLHELKME